MGLKAIDKTYGDFTVGDVVVHEGYGSPCGVKVLKKVYLDATGEYHFVTEEGDVKDNKWVPAKSGGKAILGISTVKNLRSYQSKWTPGVTFKVGSVLKDQDGVVFLVASDKKVWNLKTGTQTSQERWERTGTTYGGRVFTEVKTAGGDSFTTVVKVEDIKSAW